MVIGKTYYTGQYDRVETVAEVSSDEKVLGTQDFCQL